MLQLGASFSTNGTCWLRLQWPGSSACAYRKHMKLHISAPEQISAPGFPADEKPLVWDPHGMWLASVYHWELPHTTQSDCHTQKSGWQPQGNGPGSRWRWGAGCILLPISFLAVWSVERWRDPVDYHIRSAPPWGLPQEPGCQQGWATFFHSPLLLSSRVWRGARLELARQQ